MSHCAGMPGVSEPQAGTSHRRTECGWRIGPGFAVRVGPPAAKCRVSLPPGSIPPIPEQTAAVAPRAFRRPPCGSATSSAPSPRTPTSPRSFPRGASRRGRARTAAVAWLRPRPAVADNHRPPRAGSVRATGRADFGSARTAPAASAADIIRAPAGPGGGALGRGGTPHSERNMPAFGARCQWWVKVGSPALLLTTGCVERPRGEATRRVRAVGAGRSPRGRTSCASRA